MNTSRWDHCTLESTTVMNLYSWHSASLKGTPLGKSFNHRWFFPNGLLIFPITYNCLAVFPHYFPPILCSFLYLLSVWALSDDGNLYWKINYIISSFEIPHLQSWGLRKTDLGAVGNGTIQQLVSNPDSSGLWFLAQVPPSCYPTPFCLLSAPLSCYSLHIIFSLFSS